MALPLYFGSICWTIVYDTIYAHQDKIDDLQASVKSTAVLFGQATRPILAIFSVAFIASLSLVGHLNGQGLPFYFISVGGASVHLFWQLQGVDLNNRLSCWNRFSSNRDLGFLVWLGIAIDYILALIP